MEKQPCRLKIRFFTSAFLLVAQGYFFKLYTLLPLSANTIGPYDYYNDSQRIQLMR